MSGYEIRKLGQSAPFHAINYWGDEENSTAIVGDDYSDDCEPIAVMPHDCPHENLLLAAPEMLSALEWIIKAAGYESGEAEPTLTHLSVHRTWLDKARVAIAKAKGGAV